MYHLIKSNLKQNTVTSLPSGRMGLVCYVAKDTGQKKQNHQENTSKISQLTSQKDGLNQPDTSCP